MYSGITLKQIDPISLCKLLKKKGLLLLFKAIQDPSDSNIRKSAAKLMCMMAYDNEEVQTYICNHSEFSQLSGRICINPIPDCIKSQIKSNPMIINTIKKNNGVSNKTLYWSYPVYNEEDFPDPMNYLVGFYNCNTEKLIKKNSFKITKSAKTTNTHSMRTSTISPTSKDLTDTRPFSIPKRKSIAKDWNKTLKVSESMVTESKNNNKTYECLESVIEEGSAKEFEIKKSKVKTKEESKKMIFHKSYYSQHSNIKDASKKLRNAILSAAETLEMSRSVNKKLIEKATKTMKPTSTSIKAAHVGIKC